MEALRVSHFNSAKMETFLGSFIPPKEVPKADQWLLEGVSSEGALAG